MKNESTIEFLNRQGIYDLSMLPLICKTRLVINDGRIVDYEEDEREEE